MATRSVFICYRRDDGAHARNLYDRLKTRLGKRKIYMDVEKLDGGADYPETLDNQVAECALMVVVIGKGFRAVDKNGNARIHAAGDFVRREIRVALRNGVPIIPVRFDVEMPAENDLPDDISALARKTAPSVYHDLFEQSMQRVVDIVAERLEERSSNRQARPAEPAVERRAARKGDRGDKPRSKAVKPAAAEAVASLAAEEVTRTEPPAEATPDRVWEGVAHWVDANVLPVYQPQNESEELIEKVTGSLWRGKVFVGGRMFLTNQRVQFEPTNNVWLLGIFALLGARARDRAAAWLRWTPLSIPLSAIESVVPTRILGIIPAQITIRCYTGEKYRFNLNFWARKQILAKIEMCRRQR
jgi:hypothetical protein